MEEELKRGAGGSAGKTLLQDENHLMYYRRKIALSLVEAFGGRLSSTRLQKLLFLFTRRQEEPSYSFIPYKYGCYSSLAAYDKGALVNKEKVRESEGWEITSDKKYRNEIFDEDIRALIDLKEDFKQLDTQEIIGYVCKKHPYYSVNIEIREDILRQNGNTDRVDFTYFSDKRVVTLGYEGRDIDEYVNELYRSGANALCDVRKNAVSRKHGFSKNQLRRAVGRVGISYHHIPALGISSGKRTSLNSDADYQELFEDYEEEVLPDRQRKLNQVLELLDENKRIALTCYEADPKYCHRSRITKALSGRPTWSAEITHL